MIKHLPNVLILAILSGNAMSATTNQMYCSTHSAYISLGMTEAQVTAACGDPVSKQDSNEPVMQKVPMKQFIYNNAGSSKAFYGVWALPVGTTYTKGPMPFNGTTGNATLQINVVNNKVYSIEMNGQDSNAVSICGGKSIQNGDPVGNVYNACGQPSMVNNSYINVPIPSSTQPQVWTYQPGQYQPSFSLTFVDGKLQSINQ